MRTRSVQLAVRDLFHIVKSSFLLMAIVFSCDARAQDNFDYRRFLPLEEGNQWEYARGRDGESTSYYTQLIVEGDTTINGHSFSKITQTTFDVSGEPVNETTCAIRVGSAPDYEISYVEVDGGCGVQQCFPYLVHGRLGELDRATPGQFHVGWMSYDADQVATLGDGACHRELCEVSWVSVAADVGAYECWGGQEEYRPETPVQRRFSRSHLIFAQVGTRTYGTEWLRSDADFSDEAPHLEFDTYPNPFSSSLTLEFRRSDRAIGDLHVELYDLLGRELLDIPVRREVDRRLVLDAMVSTLPPGIYLLRARSGDGPAFTRKVSKGF